MLDRVVHDRSFQNDLVKRGERSKMFRYYTIPGGCQQRSNVILHPAIAICYSVSTAATLG